MRKTVNIFLFLVTTWCSVLSQRRIPSGNFPIEQCPKRQLPKGYVRRSEAPQAAMGGGAFGAAREDLGSCCFWNFTFGKFSLWKIFLGSCHLGKCLLGKYLVSNIYHHDFPWSDFIILNLVKRVSPLWNNFIDPANHFIDLARL